VRALEEAKRRAAKAQKEKHAAEVAAAELRGKAEAERDGQRMEVRACVHVSCASLICEFPKLWLLLSCAARQRRDGQRMEARALPVLCLCFCALWI
jgi:hypothetical protein